MRCARLLGLGLMVVLLACGPQAEPGAASASAAADAAARNAAAAADPASGGAPTAAEPSSGGAGTAAEPGAAGTDRDAEAPGPAAGPEKTTPSGLRITHLQQGSGARPRETDTVQVHYHGTFPDGRVFDSSVERGAPARFPLNRVIPCWTEGLQLMQVGGKARLVCPPQIAYGASGAPPTIPPDATLHFEVELLGIR